MIKTCEDFGHKTGLEFNSKKTVCILFHQLGHCNDTNTPNVYLNDKALKWCQHVKHLGHIMSCCSDFEKDVVNKKGNFIAYVNDIISEFASAHPTVKCKLLQIYGTSFYGSCLWNLYGAATKSLFTTWNIAIRKLTGVPYRTHTRLLDFISDLKHVKFSLKRRFLCFTQKLLKSKNTLIQILPMFPFLMRSHPLVLLYLGLCVNII